MDNWLVLLVAFPAVCALIGYITNVVAVKMIFRPRQEVRVLGIPFQGVLPKHNRHFSRQLAEIVTRDFMGVGDLVDSLNRPELLDELERRVRARAPDLLEELRGSLSPAQQAMATPQVVEALVDQIASEARRQAPETVRLMRGRAEESFDLEDFIAEKVMAMGPRGLESIIYEVSAREIRFIELYGGLFGFALGLLQWLVLRLVGDMALPIVGAVVGTVTNYFAIQMLFYPREPKRILGLFTYQGLFPKRQREIASKMGAIAARDLLIPAEIFTELAERLLPDRLSAGEMLAMESAARARAPGLFALLDAMVPEEQRPAIRRSIGAGLADLVPGLRKMVVEVAVRHVDIDQMLAVQVQALDRSSFEGLIRGMFKREEIYLIIYGGLLGAVIGAVQLGIVAAVGGT